MVVIDALLTHSANPTFRTSIGIRSVNDFDDLCSKNLIKCRGEGYWIGNESHSNKRHWNSVKVDGRIVNDTNEALTHDDRYPTCHGIHAVANAIDEGRRPSRYCPTH